VARTKKLPWLCRMGRHDWQVVGGSDTLHAQRCRRCKQWQTVRDEGSEA
jgi:hypothetical protein